MDGIIIVNKPAGFTSQDVVAKLRGIYAMKRIGHTGTLDPDATGVLPVCLGRATKLVGCLTDSDKTYQCTMRLGVITDTEDMTGNVISEKDASYLTDDEIRSAVISFTGGYDQIPPMYSAKKVNGRKLYELAREGITIERKPSKVYIRSIDDIVVERRDDEVRAGYRVECSKGTYIRSLCRDIGSINPRRDNICNPRSHKGLINSFNKRPYVAPKMRTISEFRAKISVAVISLSESNPNLSAKSV